MLAAGRDRPDGTVLGQYDRYNMQRMITLSANVSGEDLGRVADDVDHAVADTGALPAEGDRHCPRADRTDARNVLLA